MKKPTLSHSMNDSELNHLLEAAKTPAPTPTGFQRDVWFRIEAAEAAAWKPRLSRALDRFLRLVSMPSVALGTCATMVLAGAWLGMESRDPNPSGELDYVRSVSPFAQIHGR